MSEEVLMGEPYRNGAPWKSVGIVLLALVLPSAGHVFLGKARRGLILLFWIIAFGLLTQKLANPGVSFWGQYAGGLAVWALSVVDAAGLARIRFNPPPKI